MKRSIAFTALLLISTQISAGVDCKMFMSSKERIEVLEQKSCQVVADHSNEVLSDVDVCLAKMKLPNGINVVRIVLEGSRDNRFNPKKLLIVEKNIKDITNVGNKLTFTQDYFNPRNLMRSHYNIKIDADLGSMHLKLSEGRIGLTPLYDLSLECLMPF